jgi:hypothetical protein
MSKENEMTSSAFYISPFELIKILSSDKRLVLYKRWISQLSLVKISLPAYALRSPSSQYELMTFTALRTAMLEKQTHLRRRTRSGFSPDSFFPLDL